MRTVRGNAPCSVGSPRRTTEAASHCRGGHGTGKSLAYLIPSAEWALRNAERTVISTNTINLQEQLDEKDLPLVRRLVGEEVDWELVKGRGNYISIRRARLAAESAPVLFPDDRADELDQLLDWIGQTEDGSRADSRLCPARMSGTR